MPDYCLKGADGMLRPQPISLFCHFDPKKLPKKGRSAFKVNWKPVFSIMENAIVSGNSPLTEMTSQEVDYWFEAGTDELKFRASYIFNKSKCERWGVATWSRHVQPSMIQTFGSEEDKMALPQPANNNSIRNRRSRVSKGRKRSTREVTLHARRRPRVAPLPAPTEAPTEPNTPVLPCPRRDPNRPYPIERSDSSSNESEEEVVPQRTYDSDSSDERVIEFFNQHE